MTKPIDPATLAGAAPEAGALPDDDAIPFTPVPVRVRHDGWGVLRQRLFIRALAETGCVSEAAEAAGTTSRSAYRLRARPEAGSFRKAWDAAQVMGIHRLTGEAFERAVHGTPRVVRREGRIVSEEWLPSDRLLMFLLTHFDKSRYGNLSGFLPHNVPDPTTEAQAALPELVEALVDHPRKTEGLEVESFMCLDD